MIGPHPGSTPLQKTSEAADAAARLCAWARRLEEMGRLDDARRVLREALDRPDDPVPVTLMLAELEDHAGLAAPPPGASRPAAAGGHGRVRPPRRRHRDPRGPCPLPAGADRVPAGRRAGPRRRVRGGHGQVARPGRGGPGGAGRPVRPRRRPHARARQLIPQGRPLVSPCPEPAGDAHHERPEPSVLGTGEIALSSPAATSL
jgi:hypothetical protein